MQYRPQFIDVNDHLERQEQPVFLLERPLLHGDKPKGGLFNASEVARKGTFWTPTTSLLEGNIEWSLVDKDQYVRVPIFAYRTASKAASHIVGLAFQCGMLVQQAFKLHRQLDKILICHLIIGHEIHELEDDAFRFYLGLTLQTKE